MTALLEPFPEPVTGMPTVLPFAATAVVLLEALLLIMALALSSSCLVKTISVLQVALLPGCLSHSWTLLLPACSVVGCGAGVV